VRVVGRDARRLERFTQKGAEAVIADVTDASALTKAFSGATGAYVVIPPNNTAPDVRAYQERVSDALAGALQRSGVAQAVALSSFGADKPAGTGRVVALHNLEQKLNGIDGLGVLHLRAAYFMENLLLQVGVIRSLGVVTGPLRADLRLPMIATRDIGTIAAELLRQGDLRGKRTQELQGAREVTYSEAARIVGDAIGTPGLTYRQLPSQQLRPALIQMGMSANAADLFLEMSAAVNSGRMNPLEPRSTQNTTPTALETWVAEVFAPAYRGKAARA
jgi:uncharacterized protein YbjT (DUF2867 family)